MSNINKTKPITRTNFAKELNATVLNIPSQHHIGTLIKSYGNWLRLNEPVKFNELYYKRLKEGGMM